MVVLAASVVLVVVVVVVVVVVLGALYTGRGVVVVGFGLGLVTTLLAVAEYEFCDPEGKESASWELNVGKLTGFEAFFAP